MFENVKGQHKAVKQIEYLIKDNNIARSYLFYGPEGVGKLFMAFELAKIVNCKNNKKPCNNCPSCTKINHLSHPDIEFIFPIPSFKLNSDGSFKKESERLEIHNYIEQYKSSPWDKYKFSKATSIQIETIRNIEKKIIYKPSEGKYTVIIVNNVEKMTQQAANAFLKTLEESPEYVIIILITTNISSLLTTIISRCQKVRFNSLQPETIEKYLIKKYKTEPSIARISARIANGSLAKAILLCQSDFRETRKTSIEIVKSLIDNDLEKIHSISQNFTQNRNGAILKDIFDFLIMWFADLHYLIQKPEYISNIDKKELLQEFNDKTSFNNKIIKEISSELEKAQKLVDNHINHELIFLNTYFKIQKRLS